MEIIYKMIDNKQKRKEAKATELFGALLKFQRENKGNCQFELDLIDLPVYIKNQFYLSKCSHSRISSTDETMVLTVNAIANILRERDNRFLNKERIFENGLVIEEDFLKIYGSEGGL